MWHRCSFVASDTQPDTPAHGLCCIEAMIDDGPVQLSRDRGHLHCDFGRDDVHFFMYLAQTRPWLDNNHIQLKVVDCEGRSEDVQSWKDLSRVLCSLYTLGVVCKDEG